MSELLCTFPGKYGDLLWALPTVRALSRQWKEPVDLLLPAAFDSIVPLLVRQPYIDEVLIAERWVIEDTAPASPRVPPPPVMAWTGRHAATAHLGYRAWPLPDCARHTAQTAGIALELLDLTTPWITLPDDVAETEAYRARDYLSRWVCGFTDEYFELKFGLWTLLHQEGAVNLSVGPRWQQEGLNPGCDWLDGARWLAHTQVFLGDCSAWHVLAAAMGVPVLVMEPQVMRHNPVFYPLPPPQVTVIVGLDHLPTFDARHVTHDLETTLYALQLQRESHR